MGHNLNFNEQTQQHSFFSVKKKAWHGLGQIVEDYPTSSEAIQHAGLDFTVEKRELFTHAAMIADAQPGGIPTELQVPDYFATVRTDNQDVLGVVGKDYAVVQNRDAFAFFDAIVGGGDGVLYETAGALGKGERIFITAKLPDYIRLAGSDDVIEKYLFLSTSHDGCGSIMAAFTPVRVVCQNTLNAAMRNSSNVVRVKHTSNAKERLEVAHRIMGITDHFGREIESILNHWTKVSISDVAVKRLIQLAMVPNKEVLTHLQQGKDEELSSMFKNTCEKVFEYGMAADSQQLATTKGTLFGAYNAVTGYFQNVRSYKNEEAKVKSILMGGTAQLRSQKAFDLCAGFAQHGEQILKLN